ncbi:MAG: succinate--CoA ligase subunit beta [Coleofasciculaceae cyanobacterium RL_1_1]|nr:succinate--CoA ligase subunit beta [Coleofasciculaceae cyanobacterium RL_1_1]
MSYPMDLLEYQAKELFSEVGIPVLPSQKIYYPQELKHLQIPYPIVVKSQVPMGGRGKAGGIKPAANTIDAVAAAQAIFHLPIYGLYPELVLAEAKYDADRELYVAIVIDRNARRPVLLGSPDGGSGLQVASQSLQRVVVDDTFSPFYARRLAVAMGLRGAAIEAVSLVVEKMYTLFATKDLDLVEINPLALREDGEIMEIMALDGKITTNDNAIERHPDLAQYARDRKADRDRRSKYPSRDPLSASLVTLDQEDRDDSGIGVVCNGAGLTLATVDLLCQAGACPTSFLNLSNEIYWRGGPSLRDRLDRGLELMTANPEIETVLINLVGSVTSCDAIAETILSTADRLAQLGRTFRWIVRLAGHDQALGRQRLEAPDLLHDLIYCPTLDAAIEAGLWAHDPSQDRSQDLSPTVSS